MFRLYKRNIHIINRNIFTNYIFWRFFGVKLLAINANKKNAENFQFLKSKKYGNKMKFIFFVSTP